MTGVQTCALPISESDNYASQRVAQKIGFVKEKEFEVYKRVIVEPGLRL